MDIPELRWHCNKLSDKIKKENDAKKDAMSAQKAAMNNAEAKARHGR